MHKVLVPISSVSSACKTRGDTSAFGVVFEMTFVTKRLLYCDLMLSGEGFGIITEVLATECDTTFAVPLHITRFIVGKINEHRDDVFLESNPTYLSLIL
ncbi:hypothetical protein RIR_jg20641.t1 [Rhizophagus irregularis DAOM 181602=DAOM 197198]|nr:hypothetical protein RIR_jg20641.t1 [Rhizophagus irregularis DAOM 181602=DAOM 197198]